MDFYGWFTISNWIICVFIVFFLIYLYLTWNFGYWASQNVKEIHPLPIFGSLWNYLFNTIHMTDMKASKKYGKIWGMYEIRTPCLVVMDADLIKEIIIDNFQHFSDRRRFPLSNINKHLRHFLPMAYGDEWQTIRGKLSPSFTSKKINQMSNIFEESINAMVTALSRTIETTNNVDIQSKFDALTLDIIAKSCFGRTINSENPADFDFIEKASLLCKSTSNLRMFLAGIFAKYFESLDIAILPESCFSYFRKALTQVIGMRKQEQIRRNDFLQLIFNESHRKSVISLSHANESADDNDDEIFPLLKDSSVKKDAALNEDVLVTNLISFFLAGYDTIANTLSFVTYLLALNQQCQEKLCEEIDKTFQEHEKLSYDVITWLPYLDAVVSETLRLFPPITRFERRCKQDCCVNNIFIKKDMLVIIPIYALHHNEQYYPNPETFDPERFVVENKTRHFHEWTYIPFGVGPRCCVGAKFAIMMIKLTLVYFFKRFRVSIANNTEVPLKMKRGTDRLLPLNGVHLIIEDRS